MKKKQNATQAADAKKSPAYTKKSGPVHASVFLNKTKDGKEFPSVVITRRYQAKDSTWKSSDSYGAKHLKNLAELVVNVQGWIDQNYPDAANY